MHNELLPWLEQKALEAAIEYKKATTNTTTGPVTLTAKQSPS